MIQTEYLNNGTLIRHYSDLGVMLLQNETGSMYSDPVDVVPCRFTYTETNEPIESENHENATDEDYQNELRRLGVDV